MNTAAKKRLVIVGLVIAAVAAVLFAVVGSGGTATSLSVAQAASGDYEGKKVQVSGAVVNDSYRTEGSSAVFEIADDNDPGAVLTVAYTGAMPATFATLAANPGVYVGTEVKLAGYVTAGTIAGIDEPVRFVVNSQGSSLDIAYDGALPDGMEDGSAVVVTGTLAEGGKLFEAIDVAMDAGVAAQK